MSATAGHGLRFVFYGRTKTPMPARSQGAVRERERQLAIARSLAGGSGLIAISYFETRSDFFSTWRHRPKARRIIDSLSTRIVASMPLSWLILVPSCRYTNSTGSPSSVFSTVSSCGAQRPAEDSNLKGRATKRSCVDFSGCPRSTFWITTSEYASKALPHRRGRAVRRRTAARLTLLGNCWVKSSGARPRWVPNSRL